MASTDMQTKGDVSADADPADFALSPKLSFPEKLMMILEKDLAPTAIWFLPGDRTFAIHSKNFSSEVLDKYFQRTKFMSFVRKLNQWGFRRIPGHAVPKGAVAYVHSLFRKGHPELLKDICDRKKTRSKAKAQAANEAPKPAALEFQQTSSPQSSSPPLAASRAAEPSAMVMPAAAAAASLHPMSSPPQNVQRISGALSEQLQQLIAASNRNSSAAATSSLHAPLLGNLQDHLMAKPTSAANSAMAPSSSLDLSSILQRELANQLLSQSTSSMHNLGSTARPNFPSAAASMRNLSTASYLNGGGQVQDTNNMTTLQLLRLLGGK